MNAHVRSSADVVTWHVVLALVITVTVTWAVTQDAGLSVVVGLITAAVKTGILWLRERYWDRSWFGRVEEIDYLA